MKPKEVRPKPTPYIPPHIETQTPAQREESIRALLRQVETTTEPQYLMSRSSDKAAVKIQSAVRNRKARNELKKREDRRDKFKNLINSGEIQEAFNRRQNRR